MRYFHLVATVPEKLRDLFLHNQRSLYALLFRCVASSFLAVESVPLNLSTTPHVIAYLERLAETGMYGKNPTEVGESLLRERLREIFGEKEIVGRPPPIPHKTD